MGTTENRDTHARTSNWILRYASYTYLAFIMKIIIIIIIGAAHVYSLENYWVFILPLPQRKF